jgi:hypothetical protein
MRAKENAMNNLMLGLVLGCALTSTAAWAIHDIGHNNIFEEGGALQ